MKRIFYIVASLLLILSAVACRDSETYTDKKKKEASAVNKYVIDSAVKVIDEETFIANGYKTDVSKNEFVLFESTGIYLQIVREGCGEVLKDGETADVLCRFTERNLLSDTLQLTNNVLYYSSLPDKMSVTNTSGTFTASFYAGQSVMYLQYGSYTPSGESTTEVLAGWLVPLSYIKLGRVEKEGDEIAKVRIIVPHDMGHVYARYNVYPCLYDITYERGR